MFCTVAEIRIFKAFLQQSTAALRAKKRDFSEQLVTMHTETISNNSVFVARKMSHEHDKPICDDDNVKLPGIPHINTILVYENIQFQHKVYHKK